jgi:hypothetical protein
MKKNEVNPQGGSESKAAAEAAAKSTQQEQGNALEKELTRLQERFAIAEKRRKYVEIRKNLDSTAKGLDDVDEFENSPVSLTIQNGYNQKYAITNPVLILRVISAINSELSERIESLGNEILQA